MSDQKADPETEGQINGILKTNLPLSFRNKWLRDKGRSFYKGMFEIKKYMTIKWQALPSIMNT